MIFLESTKIKQYILSKVSEEAIFSYYLQLPISDITDSITKSNKKIKNIYRNEKNPSVKFEYSNSGKLKMIDYGSKLWCGDCFHIAGVILNKDCNNNKGFMMILNDILQNVVNDKNYYIPIDKPIINQNPNKIKTIELLSQPFTIFDNNYFKQFHIKPESIKNTFAVNHYWIEGKMNIYEYSEKDPCYAYFIDNLENNVLWKLYFPLRTKVKFITNCPLPIEGLTQLKGNKYLIITKSKKDKFLLDQIFRDLNIKNIDVTTVLSESINVSKEIINYLKSKYKLILTIFDNDECGNEQTEYFAGTHYIYPFFFWGIKGENQSKDVSDTSRDYGYKHIVSLVRDNYINLLNNYEKAK